MATRIRKSAEEIEAKITGGEPNLSGKLISKIEMVEALNWYANNKDNKTAAKYITDYLKKRKVKVSADIINKQSSTFGFLCRLKSTGTIFNKVHDLSFEKMYKSMLSEIVTEEVKPVIKSNVISIQERTAEKVSEIAGELEGAIDEYIVNGFVRPTSPYGILHGRAKGVHATKIAEIFRRRRIEFDDVMNSTDKNLKEGYSNFSKMQLKKLIAFCDLIILDCNKISGQSKLTRKPRKRKVKSADQLIAKVKYCVNSDEFNLKSQSPRDIIGAMQVWVFNIKTRKIGLYHAEDAGGFSIKGTSLTNFSKTKSVQKTVRKPQEVLPEVLTGGKVFLRNVLDGLKTTETALTGRLSDDVVILRILK